MSTTHPTELNELAIYFTLENRQHLAVLPGLSLTLFSDVALGDLSPHIADVLELYLSEIPAGTLRTYHSNSGYYRPLSHRQINKDLKLLRALPADVIDLSIDYSQGEYGQVGTHGFTVLGSRPRKGIPRMSSLLKIEFPWQAATEEGLERFISFVLEVGDRVPFSCGNAGYSFKRLRVLESECIEAILPKLTRFLGFEPCDHYACNQMKGYCPTAHWLNLLGKEYTDRLGGVESIALTVPNAHILTTKYGTIIQSAKRPPIGDINSGALDIGELPNVARLLRPCRDPEFEISYADEFDAVAWLARFDNLPVQDWDNS